MALSPRQHDFVEAILARYTVSEAAQHAGVDRRTGTRWLRDPEVVAELEVFRAAARDLTIQRLQEAGPGAVATLVEQLGNPDPRVASKAAADLLRNFWQGTAFSDVLKRVEEALKRAEAHDGTGRASATGETSGGADTPPAPPAPPLSP